MYLTDRSQADFAENTATDVYFLKWRYYFQEYVPDVVGGSALSPDSGGAAVSTVGGAPVSPAPRTTTASHKQLHHWVFLIDGQVNDYEEDNQHYGHESIGHISANLTVRPDQHTHASYHSPRALP